MTVRNVKFNKTGRFVSNPKLTRIQDFTRKLEKIAWVVAGEEDLNLKSIIFNYSPHMRQRGCCWRSGNIRIDVMRYRTSYPYTEGSKFMSKDNLIYTTSHELAHLRYFHHKHEHRQYTRELEAKIREMLIKNTQ